jgi:hypothetical protein
MARGRMISKSLSTSQRWGRLFDRLGAPEPGAPLGEFARTLYPLIVAHSDDWGREEGDAYTVKLKVDPGSPRPLDDFEAALQGLHDVGLILLYEHEGRRLIQIAQFDPHQSGLHKRTDSSSYPPPSGKFPEAPGNSRLARARGTELNLTEVLSTAIDRVRTSDRDVRKREPRRAERAAVRATKKKTNGTPVVTSWQRAVALAHAVIDAHPDRHDWSSEFKHRAAKQGIDYTATNREGQPLYIRALDYVEHVRARRRKREARH